MQYWRYGEKSEYGNLRKVLMHTPSSKALDPLTNGYYAHYLFSEPIKDKDGFIQQHKNFVNILEENGIKVVLISDLLGVDQRIENFPNLIYTRDSGTILPEGAIPLNLARHVRSGETDIEAETRRR